MRNAPTGIGAFQCHFLRGRGKSSFHDRLYFTPNRGSWRASASALQQWHAHRTLEIGNSEYSNDSANGTTSNGHSTTIEYSNDSKGHAAFSVATFPNVVSKHQNPLKLTWGALRERFTTHAFRTNKDGELFAPVTFKPGTRRKKENVGAIHLFSTRLRQRLCTRRLLQRLA